MDCITRMQFTMSIAGFKNVGVKELTLVENYVTMDRQIRSLPSHQR
jgi:hypothetical protein